MKREWNIEERMEHGIERETQGKNQVLKSIALTNEAKKGMKMSSHVLLLRDRLKIL